MDNSKRIDGLDCLRAIAIILVVIGHTFPDCWFYFFISSPIKIPLFFYISGFLFKSDRTPIAFMDNLFRKLIVPWLVIGLIPIILQLSTLGLQGFASRVVDYLIGVDYWFMPCLIIGENIWYIIVYVTKSFILRLLFSFSLLILGYYFALNDIMNVFMINRAMICQFFICQGYCLKQYPLINNRNKLAALLGFLYIIVLIIIQMLWPKSIVDYHNNLYYCFPISIVHSSIGCICLLILFVSIKHSWSYAIQIIGRNTLVIYLYHIYVISLFSKLVSIIGFDIDSVLLDLLIAAMSVMICCIISIVLKRYFPFIFGIKKNIEEKI